jgi:hypothetical protein
MRRDYAGKKAKGFTFRGAGGSCAFAVRSMILAAALSASFATVGCIGLAGTPAGSTSTGGGGSSTSGSSQASQLSPSAASVVFGNVTVGASTSQLVTLTAAGTANVTISGVSASGTGFSVSGKSNVTLTPGQSVTISVVFDPKAAGTFSGDVLVSSNASNSSLKIGLSGDGVAAKSSHTVALNWQPSASPVIGYFVFRGASANNLSQLNATALASTSYTDRSVVSGQTYIYAVKSIDSANVLSNFSNAVTVSVPAQ